MRKTLPYTCPILFTCILWMAFSISCKKEHSYEGCLLPPVTTPQPTDTTTASLPDTSVTLPLLPACALCIENNAPLLQSWNFKTDNTYLCGEVTEARFINEKATITFFGPSSCSPDTGLRMTIYLPEPLTGDRAGITTNNVAFYYYDNVASKSILVSGASQDFTVTINKYTAATQTATGTFNGTVFTSDGRASSVKSGNFFVKME